MAYAHKNLRVTFGGKIYGEQDIWTNTLHIGYENRDWEYSMIDGSHETNNQIIDAIKKWFADERAGISGYATLEWVKFSVIDTDGKYSLFNTGFEFNTTYDFEPVSGGVGSNYQNSFIAPQLTVAITLVTDVVRGAGRFGRIYPPLTGYPSNIGLDTNPVGKRDAAVDLIDDINGVLNSFVPDADPAVIVASSAREGKNAKVTRVRVGQVIDTQRRRRNSIPENYTGKDVKKFQLG